MLHPELSLNDNVRSRFLREGYAANSVKHPGVVLVVDDDVAEDGSAFLVMELLNGATVDEIGTALGGRLALDAACAIAVEVLDVLGAAHERGILHRDIKPANVFVTREGGVKVLDFGIARVRDSMATGAHVTSTGMLLGTPAFMAPEQVTGRPSDIDARVDLWAVGATIFNLVSGHMVHEAETGPQLLVLLATQPPRSLQAVQPEAPPAIAAVVDRALCFDKQRRWQTAAEMRDALRAACVQSFGDFAPRDILSRLVALLGERERRPVVAPPVQAASATSIPSTEREPTVPPTPADRPAARIPQSTSTSSFVYPNGRTDSDASRKGVIGVVGGLVALSVAGVVVALVHGPSPAPASSSAGSVSTMPASAAPSASARPEEQAPRQALPPPAESAKLDEPPPEPSSPPPVPETATTSKHPSAGNSHSQGAARDAGSMTRSGPTKSGCNPPYVLDQNGEKHFKPECF
jgi:serine/threonine-protein kinase